MSRLELLEKLLEKATPGEWRYETGSHAVADSGDYTPFTNLFIGKEYIGFLEERENGAGDYMPEHDAALICALKNMAAELIAATRERDDLKLDAQRYRWLRDQFKLSSEKREWDEFAGENKRGQKVYDTVTECWHTFQLQDDWRFSEHRKDETIPTFDALLDAAIADQEKKA